MAQRLVYPAIFDPTVMINRIQVTVPDVPGVKVMGTTNDDAAQKRRWQWEPNWRS